MPPSTLPDAMPDVKAWLQSLGPFGNRVFYRIPDRVSQAPFCRISRASGGPAAGDELPRSMIRVTVEVWGMDNSDYAAVRQAANALERAAWAIRVPTPIGSGATVVVSGNTTATESPDPDTGWPRMVVLLTLTYLGTG